MTIDADSSSDTAIAVDASTVSIKNLTIDGAIGIDVESGTTTILSSTIENNTTGVQVESGATAIEYGLIASGIAVALIAAVQGVGTNLKTTFGSISTAVK